MSDEEKRKKRCCSDCKYFFRNDKYNMICSFCDNKHNKFELDINKENHTNRLCVELKGENK